MTARVNFKLVLADVREFKADVLALKYAQHFYGVDRILAFDLANNGIALEEISPDVGDSVIIRNVGTTKFEKILFIGVQELEEFGYREIRKFASDALKILKAKSPDTKKIAMTIHGSGYGLDENEAILSQFAGLFEAIQKGDYPPTLDTITIIEKSNEKLLRLREAIDDHMRNFPLIERNRNNNTYTIHIDRLQSSKKANRIDNIITAGKQSETKKHIFVAMPFKKEMYDTFYYGIQKPIHVNKFLCERIDEESFTGDILAKMKRKIETASAVVADLTSQNPNVYLEIGYAWGIGKPTILVIKKGDEIKFDVQGQRCLQYDGIKNLEDLLNKEIKGLVKNGEIS